MRSPAQPPVASVWVNSQGRVRLGDAPGDEAVGEATAGFQQIVKEGALVVPADGALHPRTAIGVDEDGIVMWLVVVDGRQKQYSEGMDLYELGRLMIGLGCWNATNMDGGGSSIMGLVGGDGRLRVVNSPSDRRFGVSRIRPLPMIFAIREKSDSKRSPVTDTDSTER
jgi:exopolysaccharide biosynthesis protein